MRVAVIGGGLQGAGIAVELSLRGVSVTLFEKQDACLRRTSSQNEGKIHLGFVYANDPTVRTAHLMVRGAFAFERALLRWLETPPDAAWLSSPFQYLVHRESLLAEQDLGAYYQTVSNLIRCEAQAGGTYFGRDAGAPPRKLRPSEWNGFADDQHIQAIFETPELAIDPEPIADLLRRRLTDDPRIRVQTSATVTGIERHADSVTVTVCREDGTSSERFDHVANASWESLLAIDASAGIPPVGTWSYRVKHFLRVRAALAMVGTPSVTIVLGGFGDVVYYTGGDIFLSWYPVSRRGLSTHLRPPAWPIPLGEPAASEVRTGIYQGLCPILPELHRVSPDAIASSDVGGGIIYALGHTDIGDPGSCLHERYRVGPRSFGRYHTVDTGKYTLAPLFAMLTADRIMERSR